MTVPEFICYMSKKMKRGRSDQVGVNSIFHYRNPLQIHFQINRVYIYNKNIMHSIQMCPVIGVQIIKVPVLSPFVPGKVEVLHILPLVPVSLAPLWTCITEESVSKLFSQDTMELKENTIISTFASISSFSSDVKLDSNKIMFNAIAGKAIPDMFFIYFLKFSIALFELPNKPKTK